MIFILLNFPLLDWFLHSEKSPYNADIYELNPDTSFMYIIYDESEMGYLFSVEYSSKWMEACYFLYNLNYRYSNVCACCMVFILPMIVTAHKDLKNDRKIKKLLFYIIPFVIVAVVCVYGFCVYAPQYWDYIYDIVTSV